MNIPRISSDENDTQELNSSNIEQVAGGKSFKRYCRHCNRLLLHIVYKNGKRKCFYKTQPLFYGAIMVDPDWERGRGDQVINVKFCDKACYEKWIFTRNLES